MLSKLITRIDLEPYRVRKDASGATRHFEDDDEHEDEMKISPKSRRLK